MDNPIIARELWVEPRRKKGLKDASDSLLTIAVSTKKVKDDVRLYTFPPDEVRAIYLAEIELIPQLREKGGELHNKVADLLKYGTSRQRKAWASIGYDIETGKAVEK